MAQPRRPLSASRIGTEFYCLVVGTPPVRVQNLENKHLILRLGARSLSLKGLPAKSREHRTYEPIGCSPFWQGPSLV